MNDKALVSEEMVLRACNAYDEARDGEDRAEYPAMHAALQALGVGGWRPIAEAPMGKTMFVIVSIRPDYTTDPWCSWQPHPGEFARWPHPFPPTHFYDLPPPPPSEEG